jgi:hypothetical protein
MKQKVTAPVIALAVVVVVALCWFLGKTYLAPSPTNTNKPVFPSFIDPATGKPWAGKANNGSGEAQPATGAGNGPPGGIPGRPSSGH